MAAGSAKILGPIFHFENDRFNFFENLITLTYIQSLGLVFDCITAQAAADKALQRTLCAKAELSKPPQCHSTPCTMKKPNKFKTDSFLNSKQPNCLSSRG